MNTPKQQLFISQVKSNLNTSHLSAVVVTLRETRADSLLGNRGFLSYVWIRHLEMSNAEIASDCLQALSAGHTITAVWPHEMLVLTVCCY